MRTTLALAITLITAPAIADSPVVEMITASKSGGKWSFNVTIRHADEGWDHYANGWEIADLTGKQLGYRKLHHPHVNEQPFTRSLSGVEIPSGLDAVIIRAHDSVHEWGEPVEYKLK